MPACFYDRLGKVALHGYVLATSSASVAKTTEVTREEPLYGPAPERTSTRCQLVNAYCRYRGARADEGAPEAARLKSGCQGEAWLAARANVRSAGDLGSARRGGSPLHGSVVRVDEASELLVRDRSWIGPGRRHYATDHGPESPATITPVALCVSHPLSREHLSAAAPPIIATRPPTTSTPPSAPCMLAWFARSDRASPDRGGRLPGTDRRLPTVGHPGRSSAHGGALPVCHPRKRRASRSL